VKSGLWILTITLVGLRLPANENAEIRVIANSGIAASEISRDDLNDIFLMTRTSFAGTDPVEPVLEKKGAQHEAFLKEYLGKTDGALRTYYRSLMFTGKASIPRSFASDTDLVSYVAKTKGAIGYVGLSCDVRAVKVLRIK
jgi:hypothetical protein